MRHRHEDFPDVERFLFGETVRAVTSACLGPTAYLFNEQFVVKGARTGASFAWHQDGAYVGFRHRPYLTIWVALDDTSEENGCVRVLPRNLDEDTSLVAHEWDAQGKEKVGYTGHDPGLALVASAGTVVAFSSTTLHRSGENRTDRPRRAYVCQYSPAPMLDPSTGLPKHFSKPLTA